MTSLDNIKHRFRKLSNSQRFGICVIFTFIITLIFYYSSVSVNLNYQIFEKSERKKDLIDSGEYTLKYYRFFGYPSALECAEKVLKSKFEYTERSGRLNKILTCFDNQNKNKISIILDKSEPSIIHNDSSIHDNQIAKEHVLQNNENHEKIIVNNNSQDIILESEIDKEKQTSANIKCKNEKDSEVRMLKCDLYNTSKCKKNRTFVDFVNTAHDAGLQFTRDTATNKVAYHNKLKDSGFGTNLKNFTDLAYEDINLESFKQHFKNCICINVAGLDIESQIPTKFILLDVNRVVRLILDEHNIFITVEKEYYNTLEALQGK